MTTFAKIAAVAVAGLLMGTSLASAAGGNNTVNTDILVIKKSAVCTVAGNSEFPDDIVIFNTGNITLKKGTKIKFNVPAAKTKATYVLTMDVKPGNSEYAAGVLKNSVQAGADCKVLAII
ncbi:MAG: hypothetical protein ABL866_10785 [Devosia sp.]